MQEDIAILKLAGMTMGYIVQRGLAAMSENEEVIHPWMKDLPSKKTIWKLHPLLIRFPRKASTI